jgi:hypothetical protein
MAQGMEKLIMKAFENIEILNDLVRAGEYHLVRSDGKVIHPQVWTDNIAPDMIVEMRIWPSSLVTANIKSGAESMTTPRTHITTQDAATLQELFETDKYPSVQTVRDIAERTGVYAPVIQVCLTLKMLRYTYLLSIGSTSKVYENIFYKSRLK